MGDHDARFMALALAEARARIDLLQSGNGKKYLGRPKTRGRVTKDRDRGDIMENDAGNFERRIRQIEERNRRVEADKTWETSGTRRFLLVGFTYLAVGAYLRVIEVSRPWINAIVPAGAFMISTLTMPWFKKMWLRYYRKTTSDDIARQDMSE